MDNHHLSNWKANILVVDVPLDEPAQGVDGLLIVQGSLLVVAFVVGPAPDSSSSGSVRRVSLS